MLEDSSFLRRNGKNKDFTTTIVFAKMNLNNICTVFTSVFWNCALFLYASNSTSYCVCIEKQYLMGGFIFVNSLS